MGGGAGGNFGNTKGNALDAISNLLAVASLIPGIDSFTDLALIPVYLLRKDWLSAGFDLLGVVPIVGEIGDTAKLARTADNAIDAAKAANKASSFADFSKNIHTGRQGKHIVGHNNYKKGRSVFSGTTSDAQKLINKYSGKGQRVGNKERVDFGRVIGEYVDVKTGKSYKTTRGIIHYSKDGTHIVPSKPKWMKGD